MFWTLHDAQAFFAAYAAFATPGFARGRGIAEPPGGSLEQFLDMSHATWLAREADVGMFNHAARLLLGGRLSPLRADPDWSGWCEPSDGDLVRSSETGAR